MSYTFAPGTISVTNTITYYSNTVTNVYNPAPIYIDYDASPRERTRLAAERLRIKLRPPGIRQDT